MPELGKNIILNIQLEGAAAVLSSFNEIKVAAESLEKLVGGFGAGMSSGTAIGESIVVGAAKIEEAAIKLEESALKTQDSLTNGAILLEESAVKLEESVAAASRTTGGGMSRTGAGIGGLGIGSMFEGMAQLTMFNAAYNAGTNILQGASKITGYEGLLRQFGLSAEDAAKSINDLYDMSNRYGVKVEDVTQSTMKFITMIRAQNEEINSNSVKSIGNAANAIAIFGKQMGDQSNIIQRDINDIMEGYNNKALPAQTYRTAIGLQLGRTGLDEINKWAKESKSMEEYADHVAKIVTRYVNIEKLAKNDPMLALSIIMERGKNELKKALSDTIKDIAPLINALFKFLETPGGSAIFGTGLKVAGGAIAFAAIVYGLKLFIQPFKDIAGLISRFRGTSKQLEEVNVAGKSLEKPLFNLSNMKANLLQTATIGIQSMMAVGFALVDIWIAMESINILGRRYMEMGHLEDGIEAVEKTARVLLILSPIIIGLMAASLKVPPQGLILSMIGVIIATGVSLLAICGAMLDVWIALEEVNQLGERYSQMTNVDAGVEAIEKTSKALGGLARIGWDELSLNVTNSLSTLKNITSAITGDVRGPIEKAVDIAKTGIAIVQGIYNNNEIKQGLANIGDALGMVEALEKVQDIVSSLVGTNNSIEKIAHANTEFVSKMSGVNWIDNTLSDTSPIEKAQQIVKQGIDIIKGISKTIAENNFTKGGVDAIDPIINSLKNITDKVKQISDNLNNINGFAGNNGANFVIGLNNFVTQIGVLNDKSGILGFFNDSLFPALKLAIDNLGGLDTDKLSKAVDNVNNANNMANVPTFNDYINNKNPNPFIHDDGSFGPPVINWSGLDNINNISNKSITNNNDYSTRNIKPNINIYNPSKKIDIVKTLNKYFSNKNLI